MLTADPLVRDPGARPLLTEFESIVKQVLGERLEGYDPWLYQYCGELEDPVEVERYIRFHLDNIAFHGCNPKDLDVLDAGCGFGLGLVLYGLLGAKSLRGVDIFAGMLNTIETYRPLLPERVASRLEVTQADVAHLPYPDDSVDLLLSFEAISHYNDVDGFLREAHRVLRRGGTLAVSDGNNGLNPMIRRHTQKIWDIAENGPAGTLIGAHNIEEPMVDQRRRFITERHPDMAAEDVEALALQTSGLALEGLATACDRFATQGILPNRVYRRGDLPVNPMKGEVFERLINPFALARRLDELGFRATAHGYWGGANGKRSIRLANNVLRSIDPIMTFTARGFRLTAVKLG